MKGPPLEAYASDLVDIKHVELLTKIGIRDQGGDIHRHRRALDTSMCSGSKLPSAVSIISAP